LKNGKKNIMQEKPLKKANTNTMLLSGGLHL